MAIFHYFQNFYFKKYRKKNTTGYEKTPRNLRSLINKDFLTLFRAPIPISHLQNVCTKVTFCIYKWNFYNSNSLFLKGEIVYTNVNTVNYLVSVSFIY